MVVGAVVVVAVVVAVVVVVVVVVAAAVAVAVAVVTPEVAVAVVVAALITVQYSRFWRLAAFGFRPGVRPASCQGSVRLPARGAEMTSPGHGGGIEEAIVAVNVSSCSSAAVDGYYLCCGRFSNGIDYFVQLEPSDDYLILHHRVAGDEAGWRVGKFRDVTEEQITTTAEEPLEQWEGGGGDSRPPKARRAARSQL